MPAPLTVQPAAEPSAAHCAFGTTPGSVTVTRAESIRISHPRATTSQTNIEPGFAASVPSLPVNSPVGGR